MANKVTTAKHGVSGVIFVAPLGTALPTDASTALAATYKSIGHISEDGITRADEVESESVKNMNGDVMLITRTSRENTFNFTGIEYTEPELLKLIFGDDAVTEDESGNITIYGGSTNVEDKVVVIDMILKNNQLDRIVIPQATLSETGDVSYTSSDAVSQEVTLGCIRDDEGHTFIEYIASK